MKFHEAGVKNGIAFFVARVSVKKCQGGFAELGEAATASVTWKPFGLTQLLTFFLNFLKSQAQVSTG